jgi:hypothetical protein|tara:strand:- start:84 stop:470 length:387 start_codon:yes stop_codon:yes gene_type:complete
MNTIELIGYLVIVLKIIVAVSMLNVWLLQAHKATKWRGGNATSIIAEFEVYGLSKQFCYFVGFLKISFAILLLASLKFESLTLISSIGLTILLLGSVAMHVKVKDALYKSFPAALFIAMNLIILYSAL